MPWLTRVFPRFAAPPSKAYVLRSSTNGSWRPVDWPHHDTPFSDTPIPFKVDEMLPGGRIFKAEMDRRGTNVILTCFPGRPETCNPDNTRALARALGVEAIVPWPRGLKLGDKSHLCAPSAKRFARAFLHELGRSPELHAIASR
jgi:hypothetical protein